MGHFYFGHVFSLPSSWICRLAVDDEDNLALLPDFNKAVGLYYPFSPDIGEKDMGGTPYFKGRKTRNL
jgi:hypothetical protein